MTTDEPLLTNSSLLVSYAAAVGLVALFVTVLLNQTVQRIGIPSRLIFRAGRGWTSDTVFLLAWRPHSKVVPSRARVLLALLGRDESFRDTSMTDGDAARINK